MPLTLDLVTPEKTVTSREVEMAVIPGSEGDFGVLIGHSPLISSLRLGVIFVYNEGRLAERFFVTGGFAEVISERVTVLATEAFNIANVTNAKAEDRLKTAHKTFDKSTNDIERNRALQAIKAAEALIELLK